MFPGVVPEWMEEFESYLKETLETQDAKKREAQLYAIMKHKHARQNHPREEHLIPVAFAMAAAGGAGRRVGYNQLMGVLSAAHYEFEVDPAVL